MARMTLSPELIRLVRYHHGLTLREVAEKTGYSVTWIHNLETGKASLGEKSDFEEKFYKVFKLTDQRVLLISRLFDEIQDQINEDGFEGVWANER